MDDKVILALNRREFVAGTATAVAVGAAPIEARAAPFWPAVTGCFKLEFNVIAGTDQSGADSAACTPAKDLLA